MFDPTRRIFIADDDTRSAALLHQSLEAAGHSNVTTTTAAEKVLSACTEQRPDLIILNLDMREISGYSLLQELRRAFGDPDLLPIIALTDPRNRERALALGATEFLSTPLDPAEIVARVKNVLISQALRQELSEQSELFEAKLRDRTAKLWEAVRQLEESDQRVRLSQEETVAKLSIAAEFRDDETAHHVRRMSRYCALLAERAGVPEDRVDILRMASGMHDVGKIGIPYNILLKKGKLTPEEREFMEQHTTVGHRILSDSRSDLLQVACSIALSHHERVDGNGYPNQLKGNDIPLEARIAAIADVFDALTTDRVYRRAFDLTTALEMMREGRGTQFDAALLDTFFEAISDVLKIKEEHHDEGRPLMHQHIHSTGGILEAGAG